MSQKLMRPLYYYIFVVAFSLFQSCGGADENRKQPVAGDSMKERLITVNKIMVDNESARITEFVKRHQWHMDSTRTGVRYWVYSKGNGTVPGSNDKVKINYKLFLLDGTEVYKSEINKPLAFTLGRGENTAGLEEALMLIHRNSKAWIIVPKYLGYGMTGDGKKIPGNTTLVYEVELLSIN